MKILQIGGNGKTYTYVFDKNVVLDRNRLGLSDFVEIRDPDGKTKGLFNLHYTMCVLPHDVEISK